METIQYRYKLLNITALMLLFPAVYFILISVLKYGLGINGPFNASEPTLEWLGIKESLGWNINLLILFGPVLAFLVAAWQVLRIKLASSKEQVEWHMTIRKRRLPLFIMFLSALVLGSLFVYLVGENLIIREKIL